MRIAIEDENQKKGATRSGPPRVVERGLPLSVLTSLRRNSKVQFRLISRWKEFHISGYLCIG